MISLVKNQLDALAILDDALSRAYAKQLKVPFTGTLGVLLKSKQNGFLDSLQPLLNRLDDAGFRLDEQTRLSALKLAGKV